MEHEHNFATKLAEPEAPRPGWVATGSAFGLVTGWVELLLELATRALDPRVSMDDLRRNRHFFWMIPVSDLALFVGVGLGLAAAARFLPGLVRRQAWRAFVATAVLALLLSTERLHWVAAVALACGTGLRFGARAEAASARRVRPVRAGLRVLAVGLAGLTLGGFGWVTTAEYRACFGRPKPPTGAPNLLLIVLDNVRAESLSLEGFGRPTTPNLERLARQGVRFTQARSTAPWTLPSHASMFTGRWSHELAFDWDRPVDAARPTLAEFLADRGYATAGFVGNTYYGNALYGLGRGFSRYEDCYENQRVSPFEVVRSSGLGKRVLQALRYPIHVANGDTSVRKTAEMLNRDLLAWIDARPKGRPFFAFVNDYDAHSPFIPPDGPYPRFGSAALPKAERVRILERYQRAMAQRPRPGDGPPAQTEREGIAVLRDSYESCIAYLDRQVGRLFEELDRRGLRGNTLVVVTSDHGEHFWERGFAGHGMSLYRREVHVPLLVFPPKDRGAGGRVVSEPVSLRDLAASCVDVLGLGAGSPFPGASLTRFLRPGAPEGPALAGPVLSEVRHQTHLAPTAGVPATLGPVDSLVLDGKVYIRSGSREELYDLRDDPLEQRNLVVGGQDRPEVERYRAAMRRLHAGEDRTPAAPLPVRLTEENRGGRK